MSPRSASRLAPILVVMVLLLSACPPPSDDVVVSGENGRVFANGATRELPVVIRSFGSRLKLMPVPDDGYAFDHWEGDVRGNEVPLVVTPSGDLAIRAVFEPNEKPEPQTPPNNYDFERAAPLSGPTGSFKGTTDGATTEPGEPEEVWRHGGATVWWTYRPASSGTLAITTLGSDFDTVLGVFHGDSLERLVPLAWNDDVDEYDSFVSSVTVDVDAGTTYRVVVGGFGGATGVVRLQWERW